MKKVWSCKIGEVDDSRVPAGGDFPMRQAVAAAYVALTGLAPDFIFSGWGGELDEFEREVVDQRQPSGGV